MIHFFESDGTLITSYPATHVVTKFAFDSGDSPLLITGGKDGSVLFHNMTLWKNNNVIVGKRPRTKVVPGEFNENGSPKMAKVRVAGVAGRPVAEQAALCLRVP